MTPTLPRSGVSGHAGAVQLAGDDDRLAGVAMWRLPDGLSPGRGGLPTSGGLFAAFVGTARAEELGRALHQIADVVPKRRHIYLHFLAVAPDDRRAGVGSRLLGQVLAEAEALHVVTHLETTNPAAVPFYEAHGFRVSRQLELAVGGPRLWAMMRE